MLTARVSSITGSVKYTVSDVIPFEEMEGEGGIVVIAKDKFYQGGLIFAFVRGEW